MRALNPFLILDIDEAATREEIDAAYHKAAKQYHPDVYAEAGPEERERAAEQMALINQAYELLTNPREAERHRNRIQRLRAAGHDVGKVPMRPETHSSPPPVDPWRPPTKEYRKAAAKEITVDISKIGEVWTSRPPRRRLWPFR